MSEYIRTEYNPPAAHEHAINNFETVLSRFLEDDTALRDRDDYEEILQAIPDERDQKMLRVFLALKELPTADRTYVVEQARKEGASNKFADQALYALNDYNQRWSRVKEALDKHGIEL